jgi:ubiquitin C-terminal hydrolase
MYEYDLFAVINHEGKINNGHYTNFARFQDEVCLDAQRTPESPNATKCCSGIALMMTSMESSYRHGPLSLKIYSAESLHRISVLA